MNRMTVGHSICAVTKDEGVPCLFVQWKGYATSAQFRFIHEYLIFLIERYRISKVLGDDTTLVTVSGEDQDWIILDWIPRAIAAGLNTGDSANRRRGTAFTHLVYLGGALVFAYKVSNNSR